MLWFPDTSVLACGVDGIFIAERADNVASRNRALPRESSLIQIRTCMTQDQRRKIQEASGTRSKVVRGDIDDDADSADHDGVRCERHAIFETGKQNGREADNDPEWAPHRIEHLSPGAVCAGEHAHFLEPIVGLAK